MLRNLSIRQKLLGGFAAIGLLTAVNAVFSYYQINEVSRPLTEEIPQSLSNIRKSSELDSLAQGIRYYDELLTQSARNYAFTSDKKWQDRYNAAVPKLDEIIKQAEAKGSEEDRRFFSSVDAANLALVNLEVRAIDLVDQGKAKEAVVVLESKEYWDQKGIYSKGLSGYVRRRDATQAENILGSTEILSAAAEKAAGIVSSARLLLILITLAIMLLATIFSFIFSRAILHSIQSLIGSAKIVGKGGVGAQVDVSSGDEMGDLGRAFNEMSYNLEKSQKDLNEKSQSLKTSEVALGEKSEELARRIAELEAINKLMLGRELRMSEMKKEIDELRQARVS